MTDPLHQHVARVLGTEIVDEKLAGGAVLTLDEIGTRFEVSRTVAREATLLLQQLRLVEPRRRVGIVVQPRSDWNVLDPTLIGWRLAGAHPGQQIRSLTELRLGVEPMAAAIAADAIDRDTAGELVALALRMAEVAAAGAFDEFHALDTRFHATILRRCGNEMIAALADPIDAALTGRVAAGWFPPTPAPLALELHIEIARQIAGRNGAAAADLMRELLNEVHDAVGDGSETTA